jgi:murein DD-endopeptidase MepM/ murein hydrolase activator NlpD/pSer/pThr/pTyr-binding forkhead associated (FHA) protein
MIEIWIEDSGKELHRQTLSSGRYSFGRTQENEICVADPNISRRHLQINVTDYDVRIMDLGSTNGTQLNSISLVPQEEVIWPIGETVRIGRLAVYMRRYGDQPSLTPEPEIKQPEIEYTPDSPGRSEVATIICGQAEPPVTTLSQQSIYVGQHSSCAIRIMAPGTSSHHCILQLGKGYVDVTNLDTNKPSRIDGVPLPIGLPQQWRENQILQIGSATLHLSFDPRGKFASTTALSSGSTAAKERGNIWRYAIILAVLITFIFICLGITLVVSGNLTGCGSLNPACIIASFGTGSTEENAEGSSGVATPTLASSGPGGASASGGRVISFATETPIATVAPVECIPVSQSVGWLELPFPYDGIDPLSPSNPEQFRRISQRSRFGGRINSFFDHEFPVYPPTFGGREPSEKTGTLVTFNGGRSIDGFAQDSDAADWYSGHPGIDFSPAHPREATTPILAAAEGRLLMAKVDNDGNHLVRLEHDPDGDGFYQYATYYYHLYPDEHFDAMLAMEEGSPISARQRIGTMGTTGRSTGIHLHFEILQDINKDGWFTFFERVDPYGFFPSEDIPVDPWSEAIEWVDSKGELIEHDGIVSEYLWVHSLVDIDDEMGECVQVSPVKVDLNLYPVLGYAVVNPGFTYIARNEQGEVLREGQPQLRRITILPTNAEGVDIDTISLEYLDPELDVWFSVNEDKSLVENQFGGYTFSATIRKTGRYVLVGREVVDRVAPITSILLAGDRVGSEQYAFNQSVLVTLDAVDRGLITSEIIVTQYSLDCGATWVDYAGPFTVTMNTPHACGEEGTGSQGIDFGEGEFLLLAFSEDSENNFEQPPSQVRFSIQ